MARGIRARSPRAEGDPVSAVDASDAVAPCPPLPAGPDVANQSERNCAGQLAHDEVALPLPAAPVMDRRTLTEVALHDQVLSPP